MPTPNKKSAEAFVSALLQQKNFEGIVEGVGYVKCQSENTWLVPRNPSPSIPRGRAVSSKIYKVYIERLDKDRLDDRPFFKKRFPELTNEALAKAITFRSGSNKEVQIGRELYYELLNSQHLGVNIDFKTGMVTLRLPSSQEYNGKDYPHYVRSKNGVYSADKDKKVNTVSLDDIQQGLLGAAAKHILIGDQEITSSPYQVKVDYWDMLQNFGEYRPYIFGNKFTISFGAELTTVVGASGSADLTWLFDGKDSSIYPYMTTTTNAIVTSGTAASVFVSAGFGMFEGDMSKLGRQSLSGFTVGGEGSGIYGVGGGLGGSRSTFVTDQAIWNSGYISVGIGGDASPVSGISLKTFIGFTTDALHLSPEKVVKYIHSK